MEMEIAVRVPPGAGDFFFNSDSPCSSPFSSLSAPTTPSHAFNFFRSLDVDDVPLGSPSAVPFRWEEKPGIPKCSADQDFEFHFNRQLFTKVPLSADELFHGGKIKPLKLPPGFQSNTSPSPRSPHNSRLSPRKTKSSNEMKINEDPFEAALMKETLSQSTNYERGRSKLTTTTDNKISCISSRKPTRSLSPFRISSLHRDDDDDDDTVAVAGKSKPSSFLSAISFSRANRKWRLRDLFRSASEGRATEKPDKLRSKYVVMPESFRSADDGGYRIHFPAADRAVSEDCMKEKSSLSNKTGFLGRCLRFNRSGLQEISRDIGPLTRG